MRTLRIVLPVVILFGGLLASSTLSFAKPDYTKKEKKACTYCHISQGSKELNEAGKYYAEHGQSLEGYQPKSGAQKKK